MEAFMALAVRHDVQRHLPVNPADERAPDLVENLPLLRYREFFQRSL
jgi:hypothetical protein